ncbi:VOC family protein [Streptomyces sp. NBC_00988]|uniref:VOC family protein n=1 Tax=Streptomyces sp. NBC_00988 TaxID=2903704 RepID=UPI0038655E9D|nr:VOC family protein [Streptomyces sp. NBC_00988]
MKLDQLAYIVIASAEVSRWREFARDVLGTMTADGPGGSLYLKYDEWHHRVLVVPAEEERLMASGWSLRDKYAYDAALAHVRNTGTAVSEGTAAERELRMVSEFFAFTDPAGSRHEVCWGRTMSSVPFVSPAGVSRFVTGDLGMGHVVLPCHGDFDEAMTFYRDVMGLEYSDYFARRFSPGGPLVRAYFFHCDNRRQHSLALIESSNPVGLVHFLVEVPTLDDVGRAADRAVATSTPVVRSIGRHVNDSVVSFYLLSPSGFQVEYGCGGEVVDWTRHEVRDISYGTYWGHEWQPGFGPERARRKPTGRGPPTTARRTLMTQAQVPTPPRSPRIAPLPDETYREIVRQVYGDSAGPAADLNITRAWAHHPALMAAQHPYQTHLRTTNVLPRRDHEVAVLRIGWRCGSEYEFGQHTVSGRRAGLTDTEISRIAAGPHAPGWSDREAAVLTAVDELYDDNGLSATAWDALSRHLDTPQIIELLVLVGRYWTVSVVANALRIPIEPGRPGFPGAPS